MTATLVYQFPVTIPAGTTQAVPLVTATTFEPNVVEHIAWLFPAGCNGLVGIRIGARNVPVLPSGRANWFTRSGDSNDLAVTDMPVTGDWSVIGYNTGVFPHTVHVTFTVRRKEPEREPFTLITDADLSLFPTFEPVRHD
jgi:hypothetical protein